MADPYKFLVHFLVILFMVFVVPTSESHVETGNRIKSNVFLSPKIELEPGQVSNKFYFNLDFPRGHIAIKSFDAELVDEKGHSVPLSEAYLHHWIVLRYHQEIKNQTHRKIVKISGVCNAYTGLTQYFGLGSETRKTRSDIPDPYGIEVGNPADIPDGYQEGWLLNLHAIDTRGAGDKVGCLECACDLYNNSIGTVPENYIGGLRCCVDGARCRVKDGLPYGKRTIYLRYTVKYVDWEPSIKPARIYVLDVTAQPDCHIEYDVLACPNGTGNRNRCIDSKTLKFALPDGGEVIYGVGHVHLGGTSMALYGEGGREICVSYPKYGTGKEPGNEAGYVVGMSTCYPSPGSMKIASGEKLTLVSNYSSAKRHTGVMGLFYLLLADSSA